MTDMLVDSGQPPGPLRAHCRQNPPGALFTASGEAERASRDCSYGDGTLAADVATVLIRPPWTTERARVGESLDGLIRLMDPISRFLRLDFSLSQFAGRFLRFNVAQSSNPRVFSTLPTVLDESNG